MFIWEIYIARCDYYKLSFDLFKSWAIFNANASLEWTATNSDKENALSCTIWLHNKVGASPDRREAEDIQIKNRIIKGEVGVVTNIQATFLTNIASKVDLVVVEGEEEAEVVEEAEGETIPKVASPKVEIIIKAVTIIKTSKVVTRTSQKTFLKNTADSIM